MYTRCSQHTHRETQPTGCRTCARIAIENDVVTRTVDALLAAGYALTIREDVWRPEVPTRDRALILAELEETDDDVLVAIREGDTRGWVRFVYGNDGWDVICDYSSRLEGVLTDVNAYVDSIAP